MEGRRHSVKSLSDRGHEIAAARANAGAAEFSGEVLDANVLSDVAATDILAQGVELDAIAAQDSGFVTTITEPELVYWLVVARRTTRFFTIRQIIRSAPRAKDNAVAIAAARDYGDIARDARPGRPLSEPDARIATIARRRRGRNPQCG